MLFSIGNLLTILIVFLILALYRRLDRQNRSLEKVKRYSDNVLKNLNAVVEEKTAQIRDLSIELQVNLKTGKEILKRIKDVEDGLKERAGQMDGIGSRIADYDRVLQELVDMTSRVEENLKRVRQESLFVDKVGKRIRDSVARLTEVEKGIPEIEERLVRENRERLDALRQEMSRELEERIGAIQREVGGAEQKVRDFSAYIVKLEARREAVEQDSLAALKKTFEQYDLEARSRSSRMAEQLAKDLDAQLATTRSLGIDLGRRVQEMKAQFDELKQLGTKGIEQASREMESAVIQRIEGRLEEYEGEVEYRLRKLEEVNADVEALEENLRQAMERVTSRLQKEFEAFGRLMSERHEEEKAKAQEQFTALRAETQALEQGLQELKSQAYQTASKQLQVFENEFFADLKKKAQAMEERVQEWQGSLETRILEISQVHAQARQSLEKVYQEQLKEGLEKLKSGVAGDLKRVEGQVSDFESSTRASMASVESMLKEYKEGLRQEVEKVQKDVQALFQFEMTKLSEELVAQMKKFERETGEKLREVEGDMGAGRKALEEQFETTRTETAIWQTKLLQLMKEAENGLLEKLSAYRLEAETSIAAIRDSFSAQREDLIVSTNEERQGLKNELKAIAGQVAGLERQLALKTEGALKDLDREQANFQVEFKRGIRDLQVELEGRARDLRALIAEMKERAEEQQRAIFGRIDESAKVLTVNLADIDKRLKAFIGQTKIFERADSLRITLEGRLDEMKSALKDLQGQRKEVQEIGNQLAGTRKLAEDVQARLARFMSERRKIEDMDADFKRLLAVSQDVGTRVEALRSSNDALQEIQAKIHDLENLEKVIETRYDRLEKKKAILDSTTEGVDKSFQMMENLSKALKAIEAEVHGFAQQTASLKREIGLLVSNREKADSVLAKLSELDRILAGLEERIGKFESSREWLARTETRFEQVSREAQEQVQLLQSIVKAEAKAPDREKDSGAPPLGKREQVIKLAHQGWSSKEIAKVTKLSRGEVELILELAPRN